MRHIRIRGRRLLSVLVATIAFLFGLPGVTPSALADNSIVLPEDATVIAGDVAIPPSAPPSIHFDLWAPDTTYICGNGEDPCGFGKMVSLGTYEGEDELIFRVSTECVECACEEEELFSNDPDDALVVPYGAGQWLIAWDYGTVANDCEPDEVFDDFFSFVTLLPPLLDIPAGQTVGDCDPLHASAECAQQGEPVNTGNGNYFTTTTDLTLPGIGIPFAFNRNYNSADDTVGAMGRGWRFGYEASLEIAGTDAVFRAEDGQEVGFTEQLDGSFEPLRGVYDALVENLDGTFTLTRHDQVAYTFDEGGALIGLRDRNGQGLTFDYTSGDLTLITDSVGREIELGFTSGLLTSVMLPDDREVDYDYTAGLLTSVTDVRGGVTTYTYDGDDLLESITDQNDHAVITNVYEDGRVVEQTGARGNTGTFDWDPMTETSTFTDGRENTWIDQYSGGLLIHREDAFGVTTNTYDLDLNLASVTDANGYTTHYFYDEFGNLVAKIDPMGAETTYTYDELNDLTSITDARGNTTSFEYDGAGNLIEMTQPGSIVTTYERDAGGTGLLVSLTDPNDHETIYDYDLDGNLASVVDPEDDETTMGYDASGRMTSRVDPRGNDGVNDPEDFTWTYTYDDADHLLTRTDPLANETSFVYDDVGNLISRTDANEHTTSWAYDEENELVSVTAPDETVTAYDYDEANNLISRTDANEHSWTYDYDDANRLEAVTSPLERLWTYDRLPAGQVFRETLPSDNEITYGRDQLGRLGFVDYDDATPDVSYSYDGNGNRTEMVDGAGTVGYEYDALNRLTEVTRGSDSISYVYDDAGNLTSRTYPGSLSTSYAYDDADRLQSVTAGSRTTGYVYDEAGNVVEIDYPSATGYESTRTYDEAGRLTAITNEDPGTTVASEFSYTLDPVGNPTQVVTGTETIAYDYDELDRLTQACYVSGCSGSGLAGFNYTYDDVGNRLTQVRHSTSNTTTNYTYNDDDQLTHVGNQTWAYDDNGNLITRGSRTLTYDLENRLLTSALNNTHTYTYDGDGNRLTDSTGTPANDFRYVWDPNSSLPQIAIERDGTNTFLRNYVYGVGRLAESTNSTNAFYYLTDSLGSTANVIRHNGDVKWTYTYEPFGLERSATSTSGAPQNFMRFTGERIDTNGEYYNLRARMYDPSIGRFFQEDPLESVLSSPQNASYVYTLDRPTVATDPSGLFCVIHNSNGGCLGGGVVQNVSDWAWENRWLLAGDAVALGCIVATGGVCAGLVAGLVATQTYELANEYDSLDDGFWGNALCGAVKTVGVSFLSRLGIGGPLSQLGIGSTTALNKAGQQLPAVYGNSWSGFAGPGCYSVGQTSK